VFAKISELFAPYYLAGIRHDLVLGRKDPCSGAAAYAPPAKMWTMHAVLWLALLLLVGAMIVP
jgi:hypothetical protein